MAEKQTRGPLRVHHANRRYFADASGRAVLMTGSHTWATLQDYGSDTQPGPFDYSAFIDELAKLGHSFTRMWCWEQPRWAAHTLRDFRFDPMPFLRTGPGAALDEGPRFDLGRLDEAYFDRMAARVAEARDRGIYVAVMLFQGWSVEFKTFGYAEGVPTWRSHPFNAANNINGVDGDPEGTGDGLATHTLAVPAVTEVQRAYVRRVVEAVHGLDNVLYEVSNESAATPASRDWQCAMIEEVRAHEAALGGDRHPVLMTAMWPSAPEVNHWLLDGPADAVSPSNLRRYIGLGDDYDADPPAADGRKVILADTDHIWGVGGDEAWVWRCVMRGLNPIFMDPWDGDFVIHPAYGPGARLAMGRAARLLGTLDLAALEPAGVLASSGFALADAGRATILAFAPDDTRLTVDLRGLGGAYAAAWHHATTSATTPLPDVAAGGIAQLAPPYLGGAVLALRRAALA